MSPQEHKVERRLAAIFAAVVAGYSRLMAQDEVKRSAPSPLIVRSWTDLSLSTAGGSPIRQVIVFWLGSPVP